MEKTYKNTDKKNYPNGYWIVLCFMYDFPNFDEVEMTSRKFAEYNDADMWDDECGYSCTKILHYT